MSGSAEEFTVFFHQATGRRPYPYQSELAGEPVTSRVVSAPTGAGKTAAAILAWLWQWTTSPATTPRRLVYCLPMRVLVEQTRDLAKEWVGRLNAGVSVCTLMGGEIEEDWEIEPEKPAIVIGTQDVLLSRALNRGYAMSRYKWPVHFGLLNNDCLWVCDEVQLMGSGLATTAQLEAFRSRFGTYGRIATWWMSATLQKDWLATVDFREKLGGLKVTGLGPADRGLPRLRRTLEGSKLLERLPEEGEKELASRVALEHSPGTLTLVVVNKVDRAQRIYREITKSGRKTVGPAAEIVLAHSRFRPAERRAIMERIQSEPGAAGRIVIATQVVEAGVDLSARVLFMDLAPWSSVVQRLGRCNRAGEHEAARVFWIDIDDRRAKPYDASELAEARSRLAGLRDASIVNLEAAGGMGKARFPHVIRKKDVLELFDTTPDLSGSDVDVCRFIRDEEETDCEIFWREIPAGDWPGADISPRAEELCPVPCYALADFLGKGQRTAYRWDALEGQWRKAARNAILPGEVYLLACNEGGYSTELGWDGGFTGKVEEAAAAAREAESYDSDSSSRGAWIRISEHSDRVVTMAKELARRLGLGDSETGVLAVSARWHDRGKGHTVFQEALPEDPDHPRGIWAKAPGVFRPYRRKHFRHELASALAFLQEDSLGIPEADRDLAAYLIAAHHGRVRLSIRSMPGEQPPPTGGRFARGIWEGEDVLDELELGGGVRAGRVALILEPMEMGSDGASRSWAERILALRDDPAWGPFRLAYLESLLRAADRRVSAEEAGRE